jgi:hypothetical protein
MPNYDLSEADVNNLITLINRAPIKGEESETISELKWKLRNPKIEEKPVLQESPINVVIGD